MRSLSQAPISPGDSLILVNLKKVNYSKKLHPGEHAGEEEEKERK